MTAWDVGTEHLPPVGRTRYQPSEGVLLLYPNYAMRCATALSATMSYCPFSVFCTYMPVVHRSSMHTNLVRIQTDRFLIKMYCEMDGLSQIYF